MCLIFAFVMIVTGLTGSSVFLNQQKTYQDAIANATPSTKAILSVSDTEQLENDLANNQIDYTRIGNTTYVLNYDSSDSAQTAVYETFANNEQIMANTDTIFTVSGTEKYRDTKKITVSEKENIPDGMTTSNITQHLLEQIQQAISQSSRLTQMKNCLLLQLVIHQNYRLVILQLSLATHLVH